MSILTNSGYYYSARVQGNAAFHNVICLRYSQAAYTFRRVLACTVSVIKERELASKSYQFPSLISQCIFSPDFHLAMKFFVALPTFLSLGLAMSASVPIISRQSTPNVPTEGTCISQSKYVGLYGGLYNSGIGQVVRTFPGFY